MEITELQREEEKEWDEYVYNSNSSTFYHQIGWRNVVEKTYKHKPIYLIAKENGEIKGVLPLFLMRRCSLARSCFQFLLRLMVVFVRMTKRLKIIYILLQMVNSRSETIRLLEEQTERISELR